MCKIFERNREALNKLILTKREFERDQLEEEFRATRRGNVLIDGTQTIRDYLDQLAENGFLQDCGQGYYKLVKG